MDIQKMQTLLMEKGIRVANDDPIFTLLALNEVVLEDMTKKHQQALNSAELKPRATCAASAPATSPAAMTSLQTLVIATMGLIAGFGSHNLPAIGSVTMGIIVGFLASQASFLFQKNQDDRRKLENPAPKTPKTAFVWTGADFQRATARTTLSNRTLAACRDVLVDNASIGMAATRHGVLPPQIYKGLNELRQSELSARI
ncbi:MAG: hypothetical protein ACYCTH_04750 [Cellulomonas sp.]